MCTVCGKVTEVRSPEIAQAIDELRLKRFRKDGFTLYVYGICSTCQAKLTRQKNIKKQTKQTK
jgi:Fur family ferric uptake transcriptional regulator